MKGLIVCLAAALAATSCSTMTVGVDYDRSIDFAVFETFDIQAGEGIGDPLMRKRLDSAIASELEAKGLVRSTDDPDLLVALHGKRDTRTEFDTTTFGYGWGGGWGYWGRWGYPRAGMAASTTVATEVPVGTLIVDLVDARAKSLVWQAIASDTLDPKASAKERDRRVQDAVEKIFASFPPTAD